MIRAGTHEATPPEAVASDFDTGGQTVVSQFSKKSFPIFNPLESREQKRIQARRDMGVGEFSFGGVGIFEKLPDVAALGEVVILMVVLRVGENSHRSDHRLDLVAGDRQTFFNLRQLLFRPIEDRIDVLAASSIPAAIVLLPEDFQQVTIGDFFRIIIDRKRFGVVIEIVVARILFLTSAISGTGAENAVETPELGVGAPESSEAEGGGFVFDFRRVPVGGQFRRGNDAVLDRENGRGLSAKIEHG